MSGMTDAMGTTGRHRSRAVVRLMATVISVTTMVLAVDLLATSGHTARGAVLAGHDLGALEPTELTPRLDDVAEQARRPLRVRTPSGVSEIDPHTLGLRFDAEATAQRLQRQPRNPLTRIAALLGFSHDVEPVVRIDPRPFDTAVDDRHDTLERAAVEGGVRYEGVRPVLDLPAAGLRIDRPAARSVLAQRWLDGAIIDLPMRPFAPTVTPDVVHATATGPAVGAVSAGLTVLGRGETRVHLTREQIAAMLRFVPDGHGGLVARVDRQRGREQLAGLRRSESRPVDATFDLSSGTPRVVASRDGAVVDWERTFSDIEAMITGPGAREVGTAYRVVPPKLSTRQARDLGVVEVVGEFTTGGFSSASGENIRLVAAAVDGALVRPGARFSLNGHTGPRGTAQGYITSTIIDQGRASKAVGGGISQFATTLYNAAYFAGLDDVDHTEHAYFISRYPEAREATVFEGAIDLVIGNSTRHGVLIESSWSPSSVTVRMWSTKTVEVQSITGARTGYTAPDVRRVVGDDDCIAGSGSHGFTASNTRVVTDVVTGAEIGRKTRTVRYDPEPIVRCQ